MKQSNAEETKNRNNERNLIKRLCDIYPRKHVQVCVWCGMQERAPSARDWRRKLQSIQCLKIHALNATIHPNLREGEKTPVNWCRCPSVRLLMSKWNAKSNIQSPLQKCLCFCVRFMTRNAAESEILISGRRNRISLAWACSERLYHDNWCLMHSDMNRIWLLPSTITLSITPNYASAAF